MKKYRILNILQPSVVHDGYYTDRDSQIQIYSAVHKVLAKYDEFELWATIPKLNKYPNLNELFPNTNFIELDYSLNPYEYRLNLDITKILKQKYSIILNNVPETTLKLRSLYRDVPMVFFTYFLDTPTHPKTKDASLWPYQLSGALYSNVLTFTCHSTYQDFLKNVKEDASKFLFKILSIPTYILDFGFQYKELDQIENLSNFNLPENYIFFPNRITRPDYTNFEAFKKAVLQIKDFLLEKNYKIILANPSEKYYNTYDFFKIFGDLYFPTKPLKREEYLYVLSRANIVVSLFKDELYGGCSNTEAIYLKKNVIMPFINEYKRRAFSIRWNFFCKDDFSDLAKVIQKVVSNPNQYSFLKKAMSHIIKFRSSIEVQALILKNIILRYGSPL